MVETVAFSMFHRTPGGGAPSPPAPSPPAPSPPDPSPPDPPPAPSGEPTPPRTAQDARASRRAARQDTRNARSSVLSPNGPARPAPRPTAYRMAANPEYGFLNPADLQACRVHCTLGGVPIGRLTRGLAGLYSPPSAAPGRWPMHGYDLARDQDCGLAAGTRILTARGEVAVEQLAPGDVALALHGPAMRPILRVGRIVAASSIQVAAGALGPERPRNPLRLGMRHAMPLDGGVVIAADLAGNRVTQRLGGAVELFRIDVGLPDALLAEGVPVASAHG